MTHIEHATKTPSLVVVAQIALGLGLELNELINAMEQHGVRTSGSVLLHGTWWPLPHDLEAMTLARLTFRSSQA
jgi:hypothetical protein